MDNTWYERMKYALDLANGCWVYIYYIVGVHILAMVIVNYFCDNHV